MKKEAIKLLKQSLEKISAKDFELESWKKYNTIILSRIFGKDDQKVKQINDLDNEHSSWSLRDAIGNESYKDATLKLAQEIIQASIDEITLFGIPENALSKQNKELDTIISIIKDELKGSQLKSLKEILSSSNTLDEKKRRVFEIVEEIGKNNAIEVLSSIITNNKIEAYFKK